MTLLAHELIELVARRTPDARAVECGGRSISYAELDGRANQLAQHLQALGVGPEVVVGVHLERTPDLIVALLGVLKAGGAYLPLDPAAPPDRVALMLDDARSQVVIAQSSGASGLGHNGRRLVRIDDSRTGECPAPPPRAHFNPQQPAYVIYTSGSTGRPKGVMIEQRSLAAFASQSVTQYGLNQSDRVLQFASISFDASVEEIYPCLASGATLVMRDNVCLSSPRTFLASCRAWGITVLDLPTAYWHELTGCLAAGTDCLPPSVRLVIIGGETAAAEDVRRWQQHVGAAVRLVNTYGPTEATVVATLADLGQPSLFGMVPIGQALPQTITRVLGPDLEPVPVGVAGELFIGGGGLARGYLGRPDLTAERFVPDPFAERPGQRLYRSGDRVRWRPDGQLEFLGRLDRQVKLRGFRIELGEIEAALTELPEIDQAVVLLREHTVGQRQLVGYVVPRPGLQVRGSNVRTALARMLPDYMLPSTIIVLPRWPLTAGGKIDRRALPPPQGFSNVEEPTPCTTTEASLAQIWAEALGVERVGAHDNFFELGGYSLIALRVIAEVRATFGVDLSAHTVLTAPTVAELAQVIDELRLSTVDLSLIAQLVREIQQSPQVNPTSAGSVPGATLA